MQGMSEAFDKNCRKSAVNACTHFCYISFPRTFADIFPHKEQDFCNFGNRKNLVKCKIFEVEIISSRNQKNKKLSDWPISQKFLPKLGENGNRCKKKVLVFQYLPCGPFVEWPELFAPSIFKFMQKKRERKIAGINSLPCKCPDPLSLPFGPL